MKRKFLSLIIAFVLLGGSLIFGACGDGYEGYNLSNLVTDYKSAVKEISNVNLMTNNHIEFDYSNYVLGGEPYMLNTVNNYKPYTYLQSYYNQILDDSLSFVYNYIDLCSKDSINAPADLRDELKSYLDEFSKDLKKTSVNVDAVADKLYKGFAVYSEESLASLKNLFDSYDDLYQSAFNFSSTLSRIYFDYAYSESNPDYSGVGVADFDASKSVLLLKSRTKYQMSNLAQSYVEIYLKGSNVSNDMITAGNTASLPSSFVTYQEKIDAINYEIDDNITVLLNESEQKQDYLNSCVALYNCISIIYNNYAIYHKACNEIVYNSVIADMNSTRYEKYCAEVIENHAYLVNEMNNVIANMVSILRSL